MPLGMDKARLLQLLDNCARPSILVVGDVMLDQYVFGSVDRISPEAPVPVVRHQKETVALGGAANVARNLVALGARVILAGVVGDDQEGRWLRTLARKSRLLSGAAAGLVVEKGRISTKKTRIIAHDQQVVRIDRESTQPIARTSEEALSAFVTEKMESCSALILSDYAKGVLTEGLLARALASAKKWGKIVIVDPKGRSFYKYKTATILAPNIKELAQATGLACDTEEEIKLAAKRLLADLGCQAVVVTRGMDGMTVFRANQDPFPLLAQAKAIYDVTGAGDTVVASLAYFLSLGAGLIESASLANLAAGIVVGKAGTAWVTRKELAALLKIKP